ncbi:hypothetical protein HPP92_009364 [Vanilla planifolia]|uniref:Uncharacterized protein n=1 Tax=Vanilla planifolia TaxID=51239 RepID=A0A835V6G4_VANPL|nr:hypothetical protein HPP92_009594 [Vanilla planifolia]KAG0487269.1 hypothetical protein HPP92_009364 [Vanilla planifolia]
MAESEARAAAGPTVKATEVGLGAGPSAAEVRSTREEAATTAANAVAASSLFLREVSIALD